MASKLSPENAIARFKDLIRKARIELSRLRKKATEHAPAWREAMEFASKHQIPGAEAMLRAGLLCYQDKDAEALSTLDAGYAALPEELKGHGESIRAIIFLGLKKYDESILASEKALASPGFDTPGMTLNHVGNAYSEKGEQDRAIECYQQALASPGYDTPGDAFHNMGNAYSDKGEHDRAIECYQQALASPGYNTPGESLNNMGVASHNKGEQDRAIEFYQQALASPAYQNPEYALNNMGIAYSENGDHDRAIECYRQALASPDYDNPGGALNNMGNAYSNKGDLDRAIECYQQAVASPGYDTPQAARLNLANSLRAAGRLEAATKEINAVLQEPDTEGQHSRAKYIQSLIRQDAAGLAPSPADTALARTPSVGSGDSPEERIREKLRGSETEQKDKYAKYLANPGNERDNVFSCLRGWSSATTLLEGGADCHWSGGGYFLKWQSKGVVIDPGFDFLDNFHDARYNGREIDAVLVSHNHPDHNYDLRSVDDLRYELYRRWKELKSTAATDPGSAAMMKECSERDLSKCFFVLDDDTKEAFPKNNADHRGSAAHFTSADYERGRWYERENSLPLSIEHFPVKHTKDVPGAVGMKLRLHRDLADDLVLGYTGDTEYTDGLPAHLMGCDILLAHISMPDYQEYTDSTYQKKGHLGYNGLTKLIEATKPKLVLVGEFWAGLADLRIELVQGLRRRTGLDAILPTGLGFHLNLPDLTVECTNCRRPVPYTEVKITPATEAFGPLGYLCSRCIA